MAAPVKLLDHHEVERRDEQWRTVRRGGIGASEIGAVLGINPPEWDSPFSLYWKKSETGWEDGDTDRFRVARRLEPVVVEEWRDRYGADWDVWPAGLYRHADRAWMFATPDRNLTPVTFDDVEEHDAGCPVVAGADPLAEGGDAADVVPLCTCLRTDPDRPTELLECKTSGSYDGWGEPGSDDIPPHYLAQARWQRLVMDVARVRVAVLFLPSCNLREYIVEPDPGDERLMVEAGEAFMLRLLENDPPDPDWTPATTRTLKTLHPKVEDIDVEISTDLRDRYLGAVRNVKAAERAKKLYENEIRTELGNGWRAMCEGKRVASRSVYDRRGYYVKPTTIDRLTPAGEDTK